MFPTRGKKDKISKTLAYPLKAKAISEALADVPQAQELSLIFSHWRYNIALRKSAQPYAVVMVQYSYLQTFHFTSLQLTWSINIQPVPTEIKHRVAQLLYNEAFPKIHAWLCAHEDVSGKEGSCSYNVFYDEEREQLEYSQRDNTL